MRAGFSAGTYPQVSAVRYLVQGFKESGTRHLRPGALDTLAEFVKRSTKRKL
jgi:hypothetical protein